MVRNGQRQGCGAPASDKVRRLAGPVWAHTVAAVFALALVAGRAHAFRAEEGQTLLRSPVLRERRADRAGVRTAAQRTAQARAERAGVEVVWNDAEGVPISVRGSDLGRTQALGGGRGLKPQGQKAYAADAIAALDDAAMLFGITDAAAEFTVRTLGSPDRLGMSHVRLNQRVNGLRVVGTELIVHFDALGRVYEISGQYVPGIAAAPEPGIDARQALRIAQADLAAMGYPAGTPEQEPERVIYAREVEPQPAYEIALRVRDQAAGLHALWRYWIDTAQGVILVRYNDVKRVAPPSENGMEETITGTRLEREGGEVMNVQGWNEGNGLYYLYNPTALWCILNASTFDFFDYPDMGTYAYRESNDWGESDPVEISAACNVDAIQNYYQQIHGRNSYDGKGGMADAYVHEGLFYDNAYWDGTAMHIGDGDGTSCDSLAVLDIFAHEYAHAVTDHTCDLVYQNESGALNESFSDIFGVCVEFANQPDGRDAYPDAIPGHADWLMGEDSWLEATALRDLRDPTNPETVGAGNELPKLYMGTHWYTGMGDNGGVHYNCGVQNHFFYLLCEGGSGTNDTSAYGYNINGIGVQAGEQIAYRALSKYCVPDDNYKTIMQRWVSAARDLDPRWVRSTRAAWRAVLGMEPPPPMAVTSPSVLPDGRVGSWYSYLLKAKDGIAPYTWALLPEAPKPDWLELAEDGTVSGLPPFEAVGTNEFTVTVVDVAGDVATNRFTFLIRNPFAIPYAESFENNGQSPDSWTQSAVLNQQPWVFANGSPYGHPNSPYDGVYCARLAVLETRLTNSVTRLETPMIDFGTDARAGRLTFRHIMANWEGGQDQLRVYYKNGYFEPWQLLAEFTDATENWTLRSVDLPNLTRSYYLAFEGTANYGYGIHLDEVRIFDPTVPLDFATPEQLPDAYTERPYTVALSVINGVGPFTFELVDGALPTGMVLSADGVISGTVDTVQSALFTVRVTDSQEPLATAERTFSLNVDLPVATLFFEDFENSGNLPAGWTQEYVERAVNWVCQKGGGNIIQYNQPSEAHSGGYNATLFQPTWDVYALNNNHITRLVTPPINLGEAPGSIRLVFWHCMIAFEDGQDELRVYYKNSAAGAWTLLAEYTENVPVWTQRTLQLPNPTATYYLAFEGNARFGHGVCIDDVLIHDGASAPVITTDAWLPEATVGLPYTQTLTASGGVEPYTWAVVSNTLPVGLTFSTNGVISGTPGSAGTTVFRVAVTGGDGYASTNLLTLRVKALPAGNFTETFDAGTGLPEGWTQQITKGSFGWTFRKGSPENQPAAAHSPQTNACFYANGASYGNAIARLMTPVLNLGTGTTNATLTFWEYRAADGASRDWLKLYYRNTLDGQWIWLTNFTETASSWTQRTVALPATSPTYALAFEGFSNSGYGIGLDDVEISGDFAGYASWQSTHFTPEELNDPAISGDEADPDHDGIPNGMEYAMGLDPWSPDAEGLIWGGIIDSYLTLTFRMGKQAFAAGTFYTVEACTNLLDQVWTVDQVTEYRRDDSNEWWQAFFRHDVPVTNAPQRFLRLRVTLP